MSQEDLWRENKMELNKLKILFIERNILSIL